MSLLQALNDIGLKDEAVPSDYRTHSAPVVSAAREHLEHKKAAAAAEARAREADAAAPPPSTRSS